MSLTEHAERHQWVENYSLESISAPQAHRVPMSGKNILSREYFFTMYTNGILWTRVLNPATVLYLWARENQACVHHHPILAELHFRTSKKNWTDHLSQRVLCTHEAKMLCHHDRFLLANTVLCACIMWSSCLFYAMLLRLIKSLFFSTLCKSHCMNLHRDVHILPATSHHTV